MSKLPPKAPVFVAGWIVLCAFCNCAGWILSALHQLNAAGYAVGFALGMAAVAASWKKIFPAGFPWLNLPGQRRRFRRWFPLGFLVLALLAILGGVLHAPNNFDAMAYRVPRVLHWLAEGRWEWIYSGFPRLNTRACGFEWMSAPLIAFARTDRWLFLLNAASFLLLPGLIFSLFRRVGVKARVAWHWMWLAPSGYCFVLQAGSIANDMFSAVFALAAVDYALRARVSGRVSEAGLSVLSAALLTGAKSSNLPLLLPWLVAFLPVGRLWLARPLAAGSVMLAAAGASFAPTAALNLAYCGDWSGNTAEQVRIGGGPMWLHLVNNGIVDTLVNLTPPVFPMAAAWNRTADRIIPPSLAAKLQQFFEPGAAHWRLDELQIEDSAGWGFGLTILLGLSVAVAGARRARGLNPAGPPRGGLWERLLCLAPWVSLVFVLGKLGISCGARYLAPYYFLLAMGLLRQDGQDGLWKRGWWRAGAFIAMGLAGLLLVVSPARPLWPARWFCEHFEPQLRGARLGLRALAVYGVYHDRAEAFGPALKVLPADAPVLGLVTYDDPEASLWRPLGARRIQHVIADEPGARVRERGIKYVLVKDERLVEPWEHWLQRMNARQLAAVDLKLKAGRGPSLWHLAELLPEPRAAGSGSPAKPGKSE